MVSDGRSSAGITSPEQSSLARLFEAVDLHADVTMLYGAPIERNGVTVVPVARVRWLAGGGGGAGPQGEAGGGRGGAVEARPVGFIQMTEQGARFRRVEPRVGPLGLMALVGLLSYLGAAVAPIRARRRRRRWR